MIPTNGAIDIIEEQQDFFWGLPEKGIWKTFATHKDESVYSANQLEVDPFSCTVVSTFSALTDYTKDSNGHATKIVPYDIMKLALENMKKDGKFRSWYGAKLSDGVNYSLAVFNDTYGSNIKAVQIKLTAENMIPWMKGGSSIVTGISVPDTYWKDEQDNAIIDSTYTKWSIGHCIRIGKLNTLDDKLAKYGENYHGVLINNKPAKDVILLDIVKNSRILFNAWFYFC